MTLEDLYRLLRSGHVQSQGIVDTLREPLVVLDRSLCVVNANPAFYREFRSEREDTLGRSLFDLGNGQWDIPELRLLMAEVLPRATAIVGYEVTHEFPDLGPRTMLVNARQLSHPDNNSAQMLVVFEDVSEQRKADAAKDMLVAETRHRMKNLMAMIRSVASQTQAEGRSGVEYRDAFMGRFEAVLSSQELITSSGEAADFGALVRLALKPLAGSRAEISGGPAVRVGHYQVSPLSMILHELATNALKHGALSSPAGSVHIGWSTERVNGHQHLVIDWRESGGPPVSQPTQKGFGTKLIDFSARAEGGSVEWEFEPAGLRAKVTLLVDQ